MQKKILTALNCVEYLLVLASMVKRCVSISAIVFSFGITRGTTSSAVVSKICAIRVEIMKI